MESTRFYSHTISRPYLERALYAQGGGGGTGGNVPLLVAGTVSAQTLQPQDTIRFSTSGKFIAKMFNVSANTSAFGPQTAGYYSVNTHIPDPPELILALYKRPSGSATDVLLGSNTQNAAMLHTIEPLAVGDTLSVRHVGSLPATMTGAESAWLEIFFVSTL